MLFFRQVLPVTDLPQPWDCPFRVRVSQACPRDFSLPHPAQDRHGRDGRGVRSRGSAPWPPRRPFLRNSLRHPVRNGPDHSRLYMQHSVPRKSTLCRCSCNST